MTLKGSLNSSSFPQESLSETSHSVNAKSSGKTLQDPPICGEAPEHERFPSSPRGPLASIFPLSRLWTPPAASIGLLVERSPSSHVQRDHSASAHSPRTVPSGSELLLDGGNGLHANRLSQRLEPCSADDSNCMNLPLSWGGQGSWNASWQDEIRFCDQTRNLDMRPLPRVIC